MTNETPQPQVEIVALDALLKSAWPDRPPVSPDIPFGHTRESARAAISNYISERQGGPAGDGTVDTILDAWLGQPKNGNRIAIKPFVRRWFSA